MPVQPPVLTAAAIKKQEAEKKAEKERADLEAFNQHLVHEFEYKQDQLMKKWECTDSNCPNNQRHCWIRHDNTHFIIDTPLFFNWTKAINDQDTTSMKPPRLLLPSL